MNFTQFLRANQRSVSGPRIAGISRWGAALMLGLAMSVPAQAEEGEVGLIGLLPREVPENLKEIDLQHLPASLQELGTGVQDNLRKIYGFDKPTLEQQQEVLASLQEQLQLLHAALHDRNNYEVFDTLVDLEGKLSRRVDLFEATLATLAQDPENEELREAVQALLTSIEGYEADSLEGNSAVAVREHLARIDGLVPDNSAFTEVIRVHYFNFNMRNFVSAPFAEYAFNECRREAGPVCDFILGARVSGRQRTNSGVGITFIPSDKSAKFSININGNTVSNTRGVTNQATVFTYGHHYFAGKKVIELADDRFSWQRASLGVNANNKITDAKLNRRGLLAKLIGDKIAYNKAVDMTPKTESVAASRVRGRVLPKFNSEIEKTFGELNDDRTRLRERMAQEKIAPNEVLSRTDKDELRVAERLMNPGQLGADRPTTVFHSKSGIVVQLHQSWINNSLARETLNAENGEMSFPDFGRMLTAKFERAFDFEIDREEKEEDADRVILYDTDPVHVQFDNGRIKLIMRIGLNPGDRDDVIKLRRVEVPLRMVFEKDVIRLVVSDSELDRVRVLPLDPSDRRPIANRIIGERIRAKIEERLAGQTFDRHLVYETGSDKKGKQIPVTIAEVHAVNGWLIAVVEPTSEEDLQPSPSTIKEEVEDQK